MNGQNMIDRCGARFTDTSNVVRSQVEWLAYINAAYRQFVQATRWPALVSEATVAIGAGGRSVALSSAATQGGVVAVFRANGVPLEKQPNDIPWKKIRFFSDQASTPIWWEQLGARLAVLPASLAGENITVAYLTAPTALTTATSPVIPETYHDALVAGALAQAYRDDGNDQLATQYDGEFDRYLATAKVDAGQTASQTGPAQ